MSRTNKDRRPKKPSQKQTREAHEQERAKAEREIKHKRGKGRPSAKDWD